MKYRRIFLLAATSLAGWLVVAPAADRFDKTKTRIDQLLARRLHPPALPEKIPNPFTVVGPVPDNSRGTLFEVNPPPTPIPTIDPSGVPLTGDDDVLAYFASMLKVNGQLQVASQPLIIINQSPYKEGDLVQLHAKDGVAYFIRVIKITSNEYTIGYNDAVKTIPIRN